MYRQRYRPSLVVSDLKMNLSDGRVPEKSAVVSPQMPMLRRDIIVFCSDSYALHVETAIKDI